MELQDRRHRNPFRFGVPRAHLKSEKGGGAYKEGESIRCFFQIAICLPYLYRFARIGFQVKPTLPNVKIAYFKLSLICRA